MTTPIAAYAADRGGQAARRAARDAGRARIPTGNRQYQGVIVAEFAVAVLIVALAPIARGKAPSDTSASPSPYGVDDVKQLVGIGAVYFVLALLSSGKWGRFSAYFGGLILLAIGLAQTQSGGLPAIFGIFQPASQSAGTETQLTQLPAGYLPEPGQQIQPTPSGGPTGPGFFTQPSVVTTDTGTPLQ